MSKRQPIYLKTRRLVDPDTGAQVSALVPAGAADYNQIRERGVTIGQLLRADLTRPRNSEFHRLAHKLADLVRQNIDDFSGLGAHEALKRLQEQAEVECDVTLTDIPGLGTLRSVKAKSIAFDAMDQTRFYQLVRAISTYISTTYWPQCSPEEVESMIQLMPEEA